MLEITQNRVDNMIVLDISGRIDAINSARLQAKIDAFVEEHDSNALLLRMADVHYISAAGLRVLRILKETTGDVKIIEPSNRVIEVMEMTGLDAVYSLYGTFEEVSEK